MVKGLLIRQAFVLVDVVLALLLAFVLYRVAERQFEPMPTDLMDITGNNVTDPGLTLAKVGPMEEYEAIGASGLFGPGGDMATDPEAMLTDKSLTPPPPTLKLHATAASPDPTDPVATAIIENSVAQTVQKVSTYYQGQPVTDQLYLVEVYPRKVVLENRTKNTKSELTMEEATEKAAKGTPAAMASAQRHRPMQLAANTANTVALDRNAVVEEMASYDTANVVNTLNPQMAEDGNGKITGITSDNFSSVPLAAEVGLKDGDVVNTVNGIKIDSDQKLFEITKKFGNASTFRLGITRNGSPMMLTIKLE